MCVYCTVVLIVYIVSVCQTYWQLILPSPNMRLQLFSVCPTVSLSLLLEWYVTIIVDSQRTVSALEVVFHLPAS